MISWDFEYHKNLIIHAKVYIYGLQPNKYYVIIISGNVELIITFNFTGHIYYYFAMQIKESFIIHISTSWLPLSLIVWLFELHLLVKYFYTFAYITNPLRMAGGTYSMWFKYIDLVLY